MNMEDVYVKDDDDDLPSLPRAVLAEPKEKKGFFNKIKRKKSNSERPKPEEVAKNSAVLSEPEEKDEKVRIKGSNSARESVKNEEKIIPKTVNNSLHIRKGSGSKEEIIPEVPIVKETAKKDIKCPIPPSPNSIVKRGSITKPEMSKNQEGLENKERKETSSTNTSLKVEANNASIEKTVKRPMSECEEDKKLNYSVEEERKEEKVMQEPKVNNKTTPKENVAETKIKFESGSVSSESLSRKSFYQDDPFLDEFLANKHMQASKSEAKLNNKPQAKKLTNSLIQLRREEATNYKVDYKAGKACGKCIVI